MTTTSKAIMRACKGLRTIVDPSEVPYDSEENTAWLSACSNVDITDAFKIKRRCGYGLYQAQALGVIHSLCQSGGQFLFVEHDALSLMPHGGPVSRLRNVTPGARTSFARDHEGRIFHANGFEHGFIKDGMAHPWAATVETPVVEGDTRSYSDPPQGGHIVATFGSRMLLAVGQFLIASGPFNPLRFVLDEGNIPFDSRLRMIKEVRGGLYVSTSKAIWFLSGRSFTEMDLYPVHEAPAVEGTDCYCEPLILGMEGTGKGVIVTTEDSVVFLTDDGQKVNLTDGFVTVPAGAFGSAAVINGRYIVHYYVKK